MDRATRTPQNDVGRYNWARTNTVGTLLSILRFRTRKAFFQHYFTNFSAQIRFPGCKNKNATPEQNMGALLQERNLLILQKKLKSSSNNMDYERNIEVHTSKQHNELKMLVVRRQSSSQGACINLHLEIR